MTPLIIVPARQMSQGRHCKNRAAWPALRDTLNALVLPTAIVTDDPWIRQQAVPWSCRWLPMPATHTVAEAVRYMLTQYQYSTVVVLQPSSPTANRADYVRTALSHLETCPDVSSVISVVLWTGEPPSKACTLNEQGHLVIPHSPEPRQLQPQHYRRDGTVYAVRTQYATHGDLYGPTPIPLLIDPKDSVTLD